MTSGDIYTVAGDGTFGYTGDGGPATGAELKNPQSVAVDGAGNLLIADSYTARVRAVAIQAGSFYGRPMTAGDIYTAAGNGRVTSGDRGPALAAELGPTAGTAVDGSGNTFVADGGTEPLTGRVQMLPASSGTFFGQAMTAGNVYTVAGTGKTGFTGDGGPATSAELSGPAGVAVDAAGNLLISDWGNNRIRVVAAASGTFYGKAMTAEDIYTVAGDGTEGYSGDGGKATAAEIDPNAFNDVCGGLAVDAAGNLVLADTFNSVVRVVAEKTGTFYGVSMTAGNIYTVAGNGMEGFTGDGGPATSAELIFPAFVTVTAAGTLLITDLDTGRVRAVTGGPAA